MAKLAAIDIGSNAIRLRIVEVDAPTFGTDGTPRFSAFRDLVVDRASVRLGHDVFTKGHLETGVIGQACEALKRFRAALDQAGVDRYRAVATSAAREASNGDILVERAEREAGIAVDVIEGVEEARLVQMAVTERVRIGARSALLVDIGGGSTELTVLRGGSSAYTTSLPIGTVRLVEAFLGKGPIASVERRLLEEYVDRCFAEVVPELLEALRTSPANGRSEAGPKVDVVIGSGGNIETLADLCPVPSAFPEGRAIEIAKMVELLSALLSKSVEARVADYGLRPDRADTIVPAALVLARVAEAVGQDSIMAPGVGLKEGVLVDLARKHFVVEDPNRDAAALTETCLRVGRRYRFDEGHGVRVAAFATKLFDELGPRHRMTSRDRMLLHAAALLHDVGDFVRYEGHHKHSYYLILHSDFMGMTAEERAIVANTARYHRKSPPHVDHDNFRALSQRDRAKVKAMASILRIADALDREHRAKVQDFVTKITDTALTLELMGSDDRALEEWTVLQKAGLLKEAFGLDVRIEPTPTSTRLAPPSVTRSES